MEFEERFRIRTAVPSDLPGIGVLIRESFFALLDSYPELTDNSEFVSRLDEQVSSALSSDLDETIFAETYLSSPNTHFWVTESVGGDCQLVACLGLKKKNQDEAELVRMAVHPDFRGSGVGSTLLSFFDKFCIRRGICRALLATANHRASKFYTTNGFTLYNKSSHSVSSNNSLTVYKMAKFYGEKLITRVSIIGGTHGNERTGIELLRQWSSSSIQAEKVKRSTFSTQLVLGNPAAARINQRFVDVDLNRQFSIQNLNTIDSNSFRSVEAAATGPYEVQRARHLNELLGPKDYFNTFKVDSLKDDRRELGTDFIIDLHTSNSNVGCVAMISSLEDDMLAARACQYLVDKSLSNDFTLPPIKITSHTLVTKPDSWSVDSISPNGLSFEIGPIAHGTLNSTLLEATRSLVCATLDFIENHNRQILDRVSQVEETSAEEILASKKGLMWVNGHYFAAFPEHANARKEPSDFRMLEYYNLERVVEYPELHCDENPPSGLLLLEDPSSKKIKLSEFLIHPNLLGQDWNPVRIGDAVFIATDGSGNEKVLQVAEHVPGNKTSSPASMSNVGSDQEYFPMFINEAAYQEMGIAFALLRRASMVVL